MNETVEKFASLLILSAEKQLLKKAIFSKPADKNDVRTVLTLRRIAGEDCLQAETFRTDNKALHKNLPVSLSEDLASLLTSHGQVNLITTLGDCELRSGKHGNTVLLGFEKLQTKLQNAEKSDTVPPSNDKQKQYILSGNEPFLVLLGVSDKNGRVKDKKQAKFRQINRFLELVRDCLDFLPTDSLRICDLCCGKSYLSFAVYHYFANILGRKVKMTGVDLKPDVIEFCSDTAKQLHFDGLEFLCGDVSKYDVTEPVDLVVSLHACDIATDFVLERAVAWHTKVILSTPCCHHELNRAVDCPELSFVTAHSMLRQKLCDAVTDALRLKYLESYGYNVTALELIDPEETPKNILLRGILREKPDDILMMRAKEDYLTARKFLTGGKGNVQKILY